MTGENYFTTLCVQVPQVYMHGCHSRILANLPTLSGTVSHKESIMKLNSRPTKETITGIKVSN